MGKPAEFNAALIEFFEETGRGKIERGSVLIAGPRGMKLVWFRLPRGLARLCRPKGSDARSHRRPARRQPCR